MTGPAHLATYVVLCPDRLVRHAGTFPLSAAQALAGKPTCCPIGDHRVVRASAWKAVA